MTTETKRTDSPFAKIRIAGTVCDVTACELLVDRDTIVAGSGINCDLVVQDPLVPPKAFVLNRIKHHHDKESCSVVMMMNAMRGARVYVNGSLSRRSFISIGDTLSLGCHSFVIEKADDGDRNRKLNVQVSDICSRLMNSPRVPVGFLANSGLSKHRKRMKTACEYVGLILILLATFFFLLPRTPQREMVQEPLLITMITEQMMLPEDAVRPLEDVVRKTYDKKSSELPEDTLKPDKSISQAGAMSERVDMDQKIAPSEPVLEPVKSSALAALDKAMFVGGQDISRIQVNRMQSVLGDSAPVRRLSREEASNPLINTSIGNRSLKPAPRTLSLSRPHATTTDLAGMVKKGNPGTVKPNSAQGLERLKEFYKASPVEFEPHKDITVPVARISEELQTLEDSGLGNCWKADGLVSDDEKAASWKSGQLKVHAAGKTPPLANPPTFCYVSRAKHKGKPCLYISFVCMDPDLKKLVVNNSLSVNRQDSIEIYLDTNFNRHDYYHLLVGAGGKVTAKVQADARNIGEWNTGATIKTAVNRTAKQWTCEIMIPFDRLGGAPKKGQRWGVNLCRNFRGQVKGGHDPRRVQSWFSVFRNKPNSYHNADLFGVFQW